MVVSLSRVRSKPVLTKTQSNCSPIALCNKAASTVESTPPERASNTFSLPTFVLISAISCSKILGVVQLGWQWQIFSTKRANIFFP